MRILECGGRLKGSLLCMTMDTRISLCSRSRTRSSSCMYPLCCTHALLLQERGPLGTVLAALECPATQQVHVCLVHPYVTREPLALFHTDCTALTRIALIALQPIRVTAVQSVCDSAWTDPQRFCACSASSPLRLIWLMTTMLWIAIRHPYGRPCSERTLIPYPQPRGLSQAR